MVLIFKVQMGVSSELIDLPQLSSQLCDQFNCESKVLIKRVAHLVLRDGNQALAAEPGFHGDPPKVAGLVVMAVRRFFEYRSEPLEQQPENGLKGKGAWY